MNFVGMNVSIRFDGRPVQRAADRARRRYLFKAGAYVRQLARRSIKRLGRARKEPKKFTARGKLSAAWIRWRRETRSLPHAPAGQPPFTHKPSGGVRNAIVFAVDAAGETVFVGVDAGEMDDSMRVHEEGGRRFGRTYPARPFMRPAMERAAPKLPTIWAQAFGRA